MKLGHGKRARIDRALADAGVFDEVIEVIVIRPLAAERQTRPPRRLASAPGLGAVLFVVTGIVVDACLTFLGNAPAWVTLPLSGGLVIAILVVAKPWQLLRRQPATLAVAVSATGAYVLSLEEGWVHVLSAESTAHHSAPLENDPKWIFMEVKDAPHSWRGEVVRRSRRRVERFDRTWRAASGNWRQPRPLLLPRSSSISTR